MGSVSVGYSEAYYDSGIDGTTTAATTAKTIGTSDGIFENQQMSIAFNVNDNLSISYTDSEDTYDAQSNVAGGTEVADVTQETEAIQAAYSMGSMSIKGYQTDTDDTADIREDIINDDDMCCDKIHIVYGDFDKNDNEQPYKRYKITYFAMKSPNDDDTHYGIYKTKESWIQRIGEETGSWTADNTLCAECYSAELIRDHLTDMEFNAFGKQGKIFDPPPAVSYTHLTLPTILLV